MFAQATLFQHEDKDGTPTFQLPVYKNVVGIQKKSETKLAITSCGEVERGETAKVQDKEVWGLPFISHCGVLLNNSSYSAVVLPLCHSKANCTDDS